MPIYILTKPEGARATVVNGITGMAVNATSSDEARATAKRVLRDNHGIDINQSLDTFTVRPLSDALPEPGAVLLI